MSQPVGVLECLVKLSGDGDELGAGFFVGGSYVATCAHVVDQAYGLAAYGQDQFSRRHEHNKALEGRVGQTVATAETFDGEISDAELVAVDPVEDLVLLKLRRPPTVRVLPVPLDMADGHGAADGRATAFGFRKTGQQSFRVELQAVNRLITPESGTGAPMFEGSMTPGMSGGPIVGRRGGRYCLMGMAVLGNEGSHWLRAIEPSRIKRFLEATTFLPVSTEGSSEGSFGATTKQQCALADFNGPGWSWIRSNRPSDPLNDVQSLCYIASRPLLMSEIDFLFSINRSSRVRDARLKYYVELTASEVDQVLLRLAEVLRAPVSIAGPADPYGLSTGEERSLLPVAMELDPDGSDYNRLPQGTLEWRREAGSLSRRPTSGSAANRVMPDLSVETIKEVRALFRPALVFPMWRNA